MSSKDEGQPVRVALYVRASTESQKYSVPHQVTLLTTYAASRGYLVERTYVDDGRSGLTLAERPGLQALLGDVVEGAPAFSRVLVVDVSRWGRFQDHDEAAHYEYVCREGGVAVDYCYEAFENGPGAMANLVKNIKRIMAAEFSRELSQKVQLAQRRHAAVGFKMGGPAAYGFRRVMSRDGHPIGPLGKGERKSLASDKIRLAHGPAHELCAIREIFRLFVREQLSLTEVARRMSNRGGRPKWTRNTVRNVLVNELVIGVYVFNRRSRLLKGPIQRNAGEDIVRARVLSPIVSTELFSSAARLLSQREPRRYQSNALICDLQTLLAHHGYLNGALIREQFGQSAIWALKRRFGSVGRACSLAGYPWFGSNPIMRMDGLPIRKPWAPRIADSDLLAPLELLLGREGRLSSSLVRLDAACADPQTYRRRFGTLEAAFGLVGYDRYRPMGET